MYAVWRYDLFPYILCGKVEGEPNDHGQVRVGGHPGYLFNPIELVSDKRGKEIQVSIQQAKRLYEERLEEIKGEIADSLGIYKYLPA